MTRALPIILHACFVIGRPENEFPAGRCALHGVRFAITRSMTSLARTRDVVQNRLTESIPLHTKKASTPVHACVTPAKRGYMSVFRSRQGIGLAHALRPGNHL